MKTKEYTLEEITRKLHADGYEFTTMVSCEDANTTYVCLDMLIPPTRLVFRNDIYVGWYNP